LGVKKVNYPLPPKGGSRTAIEIRISAIIFSSPALRDLGVKKGEMRNLLRYDQDVYKE
jgi:hypothetical protein